jgi:tetratricopeptide (TPR) repeat protein
LAGIPAVVVVWTQWRGDSVSELNRKCHSLSLHSQWNELAEVAARWAVLQPQSAEPWLMRAEAAEGMEDWAHVVEFLDHVPRNDPRAVGIQIRKATIQFENLNQPRAGVKTCDELLKLDPRVLPAHKQIIFFYTLTLQRAEMVRRIRQAIRMRRESPESYVYLVGTSWLYSSSLYRHNSRWLESAQNDETFEVAQALQVYVSEAKTDLLHAADFEHIPPPEQLLEKYPHNLELVAYFLNQSISDGDLDRVLELLEAAPQELSEADARIWRARAWVADVNGDFAAAEQALRKAFELDPYWWQIHFQLHDLLRRRGRQEESAKYFEVYRISKALATEIKTLTKSAESMNNRKFLESVLKLAEFANDEEVATALKERIENL